MNFVEIDGMLINFDNVTCIAKSNKIKGLRIFFLEDKDYIDIPIDDEKEFDRIWSWLKIKVSN